MLVSLGKRALRPGIVPLLADCHAKIRFFSRLAVALGQQSAADEADVAARCGEVRRYFREALPLHVADEEESIRPRLAGHADALAQMHAEHDAHREALAALDAALSALSAAPRSEQARAALRAVAEPLAEELEEHLVLEETSWFPTLAALPTEVQDAIIAELRARRAATD